MARKRLAQEVVETRGGASLGILAGAAESSLVPGSSGLTHTISETNIGGTPDGIRNANASISGQHGGEFTGNADLYQRPYDATRVDSNVSGAGHAIRVVSTIADSLPETASPLAVIVPTLHLAAPDPVYVPPVTPVVPPIVVPVVPPVAVNHAPTVTFTPGSVADTLPSGSVVGTFTTHDADGDAVTVSISGPDAAKVRVEGNSVVTTCSISGLSALDITLTATDSHGASGTDSGTVTVSPPAPPPPAVNHAPTATMTLGSVQDDVAIGTTVGTYSASDPDVGDSIATLVLAGADADKVAMDGHGHIVTTASIAGSGGLHLTLTAADTHGATGSTSGVVTVTAHPVNHAPAVSLTVGSFQDNVAIGTIVAIYSATDPDAGDSVASVTLSGADADKVALDGHGHIVTTASLSGLSGLHLTVTASDTHGASGSASGTVTVTPPNHAPSVSFSADAGVLDTAAIGTEVGTYTVSDPDVGDTVGVFISGANSNKVQADGHGHIVTRASIHGLDHLTFNVVAYDSQWETSSAAATVAVGLEAPTSITLATTSVTASTGAGVVVSATNIVDHEAGSHTVSLVAGGNANLFSIDGSGRVVTAGDLPVGTYHFTLRVTNNTDGLHTDTAQTLTVTAAPDVVTAGDTKSTIAITDLDSGNTPFSTATVSATDASAVLNGHVYLTHGAGTLTAAGLSNSGTTVNISGTVYDVYDMTAGNAAAMQTLVRGIQFNPSVVGAGSHAVKTGFDIVDPVSSSDAGFVQGNTYNVTHATNTVTIQDGAYNGQVTIEDCGHVAPFVNVNAHSTIASSIITCTIKVTDNRSDGTLNSAGAVLTGPAGLVDTGTYSGSSRVYTVTGTADDINTVLHQVVANAQTRVPSSGEVFGGRVSWSIVVTDPVSNSSDSSWSSITTYHHSVSGNGTDTLHIDDLAAANGPFGDIPSSIGLTNNLRSVTVDQGAAPANTVLTVSFNVSNYGDPYPTFFTFGAGPTVTKTVDPDDSRNETYTLAGTAAQLTSAFQHSLTNVSNLTLNVTGSPSATLTYTPPVSGSDVTASPLVLSNWAYAPHNEHPYTTEWVPDNAAIGTALGKIGSTDIDGNPVTITFIQSSYGAISMDPDGTLRTTKDISSYNTLGVSLIVTDSHGNSDFQTATFYIQAHTPVAPTAVTLSNSEINALLGSGATVGALGTTDAETGAHTYAIVGGADAAKFSISGGNLVSGQDLDFGTYHVDVRSTNNNDHLTVTTSFTVTVDALAPTAVTLSNSSINALLAGGSTVGALGVTDAESGAHTYSIVAGGDGADFSIVGGNLVTSGVLDYGTYHVTVRALNTTTNQHLDHAFTVTVDAIAPADVELATTSVTSSTGAGVVVSGVTVTDAEAGTHTVTLGGADAGLFSLDGQGRVVTVGDLAAGTYHFNLHAVNDADGKSVTVAQTLTVSDVPPTISGGYVTHLALTGHDQVFQDAVLHLGSRDNGASTYTVTITCADNGTLYFPSGITGVSNGNGTSTYTLAGLSAADITNELHGADWDDGGVASTTIFDVSITDGVTATTHDTSWSVVSADAGAGYLTISDPSQTNWQFERSADGHIFDGIVVDSSDMSATIRVTVTAADQQGDPVHGTFSGAGWTYEGDIVNNGIHQPQWSTTGDAATVEQRLRGLDWTADGTDSVTSFYITASSAMGTAFPPDYSTVTVGHPSPTITGGYESNIAVFGQTMPFEDAVLHLGDLDDGSSTYTLSVTFDNANGRIDFPSHVTADDNGDGTSTYTLSGLTAAQVINELRGAWWSDGGAASTTVFDVSVTDGLAAPTHDTSWSVVSADPAGGWASVTDPTQNVTTMSPNGTGNIFSGVVLTESPDPTQTVRVNVFAQDYNDSSVAPHGSLSGAGWSYVGDIIDSNGYHTKEWTTTGDEATAQQRMNAAVWTADGTADSSTFITFNVVTEYGNASPPDAQVVNVVTPVIAVTGSGTQHIVPTAWATPLGSIVVDCGTDDPNTVITFTVSCTDGSGVFGNLPVGASTGAHAGVMYCQFSATAADGETALRALTFHDAGTQATTTFTVSADDGVTPVASDTGYSVVADQPSPMSVTNASGPIFVTTCTSDPSVSTQPFTHTTIANSADAGDLYLTHVYVESGVVPVHASSSLQLSSDGFTTTINGVDYTGYLVGAGQGALVADTLAAQNQALQALALNLTGIGDGTDTQTVRVIVQTTDLTTGVSITSHALAMEYVRSTHDATVTLTHDSVGVNSLPHTSVGVVSTVDTDPGTHFSRVIGAEADNFTIDNDNHLYTNFVFSDPGVHHVQVATFNQSTMHETITTFDVTVTGGATDPADNVVGWTIPAFSPTIGCSTSDTAHPATHVQVTDGAPGDIVHAELLVEVGGIVGSNVFTDSNTQSGITIPGQGAVQFEIFTADATAADLTTALHQLTLGHDPIVGGGHDTVYSQLRIWDMAADAHWAWAVTDGKATTQGSLQTVDFSDAPSAIEPSISLDNASVSQFAAIGTVVGNLTLTDPSGGHTLEIYGSGSGFAIDNQGHLVTTAVFDAAQGDRSVTVAARNHLAGADGITTFTVHVTGSPAPTIADFNETTGSNLSVSDVVGNGNVDSSHVRVVSLDGSDMNVQVQTSAAGNGVWTGYKDLHDAKSNDGALNGDHAAQAVSQAQLDSMRDQWIAHSTLH